MNEIITYEGDKPILNAEVAKRLAEFEKTVKLLKEKEDELKHDILCEMEMRGILKLETDDIAVSYIAATARETFDSKTFRKDNPDLYDKYINIKPVSASIRIKVKG